MIGRRFIAIVNNLELSVGYIEVIDRIEEMWFDDDSFSKEEQNQSPGIIMNNQNKFVIYVCFELNTRQVLKVQDNQLLYDITGLDLESDLVKKAYDSLTEDAIKERDKLKKNREVQEELDLHYQHCIELGMSHDEAIDNMKEMIEIKYRKKNEQE